MCKNLCLTSDIDCIAFTGPEWRGILRLICLSPSNCYSMRVCSGMRAYHGVRMTGPRSVSQSASLSVGERERGRLTHCLFLFFLPLPIASSVSNNIYLTLPARRSDCAAAKATKLWKKGFLYCGMGFWPLEPP